MMSSTGILGGKLLSLKILTNRSSKGDSPPKTVAETPHEQRAPSPKNSIYHDFAHFDKKRDKLFFLFALVKKIV